MLLSRIICLSSSSGLVSKVASSLATQQCISSAAPRSEEPSASTSTEGRLLDLFATPDAIIEESRTKAGASSSSTKVSIGKPQAAQKNSDRDVVQLILQAVENCKPLMKVQSIKTGTKVIHVPKVVLPEEQRSLAVRWIIQAAHNRKDTSKRSSMAECLALELLLAYRKEGTAHQKRDDLHKLALENKSNVAGYSLR